ncbi:MAG TPA: HD domain-containing phosphohydrolase [Candidatus Elarobacter sp.]
MTDILVVDDHEPNLLLYKKVLAKVDGATARCYTDAREALAWAKLRVPLLVVVDQTMPEFSGLDFVAMLRAIPGRENVPFIMVTASDERELRREALRSGALGFLTKPVDPVEFLTLSVNVIAADRGRREAVARADDHAARAKDSDEAIAARDIRAIDALVLAMAARDPQLAMHSEQVAAASMRLAQRLGLSEIERTLLANAVRVHDVGKLVFNDRIMTGTTRLTPAERRSLEKHVEHGRAILAAFDESESPLLRMAYTVASAHHERWDGAGYPAGLRGESIPLVARIVAVADAYSALTAARPWRAAMSPGHALATIESARGTAYDPRVVAALREAVSSGT